VNPNLQTDKKIRRALVKSKSVKELMIPLVEYATVHEDATLFEAVLALEKTQAAFNRSRYKHRAILVFDNNNQIVGKVSQMDLIRALEPKYGKIGDPAKISRAGFSPQFLKSMLDTFGLWQEPLAVTCEKASKIKAKDFMYTPTEGEYIKESAMLGEAIHQLVMGHHHSLLVLNQEEKIVGILRLSDVFEEISQTIKACEV
jgi:CBS domain-containing protein